jgi:hypothetical protein
VRSSVRENGKLIDNCLAYSLKISKIKEINVRSFNSLMSIVVRMRVRMMMLGLINPILNTQLHQVSTPRSASRISHIPVYMVMGCWIALATPFTYIQQKKDKVTLAT